MAQAQNLDPMTFRLEPAFVENRGQAPAGYTHALNPGGWLFACDRLAAPASSGFSQLPEGRKLLIEGANAACLVETASAAGLERFYPSGAVASRFPVLRYRGVLDGVDAEYEVVAGALRLTFISPDPARLAAIRLRSAGETPWIALPPVESAGSLVYSFREGLTFDPVQVGATPAMDREGNWYFSRPEETWAAMDSGAETCLRGGLGYRCPDVSIASFTPAGSLRYLTHFRGRRFDQASALATGPGGDLYLTGTTYSEDFPVTPGAYQTVYAGPAEMRQVSRVYPGGDIFLAKLHGGSGELLYSTFLGSAATDRPVSLGVDSGGRAYLGLETWSRDFVQSLNPLFPPSCSLAPDLSERCPWIAALDESGARLAYAMPQPPDAVRTAASGDGRLAILSAPRDQSPSLILLSQTGEAIVGRFSLPQGSPYPLAWAPDGALWTAAIRYGGAELPAGYLARVSPDVAELRVYDTAAPVQAIAIHPNGWLSVLSEPYYVPDGHPWRPASTALLPQPCAVSALLSLIDPAGNHRTSTFIPGSSHAFVTATEGVVTWQANGFAPGVQVPFGRLDWNAPPVSRLLCTHTPSGSETQLIASGGALIELMGPGIGSHQPADSPLGPDGRLAEEFAGLRVSIAGLSARVLSAGPSRMTVVLPQHLAASSSEQLIVTSSGDPIGVVNTATSSAIPAAVTAVPGLAPKNEDGRPNTLTAPAEAGSVVTVYAAGMGPLSPPLPDGQIRHDILAAPTLPLAASILAQEAEIVSARQFQGFPSGVLELRVRMGGFPGFNPGDYAFDLNIGLAPGPVYFGSARYRIFIRVPQR